MNHKILMETESPELSKSLHETGEIAPKAVKTADCKSDAEWYFQQSEASREFYEVFFDTCHKYDVSWSQASPVVKELISCRSTSHSVFGGADRVGAFSCLEL